MNKQADTESTVDQIIEAAWGLIANAGGGDWTRESQEWQDAAARWRTDYHARLSSEPTPNEQ